MIQDLPIEIQSLIIDHLECGDTYHLLLTERGLNDEFKDELKKRYYYRILQKLVNKDYTAFKNEIQGFGQDDLEKVFFYSLNHIDTVWFNEACGFYNMNYILECMFHGCRITEVSKLQSKAKHFYKYFYHAILDIIVEGDRSKTQQKIDNIGMLKSLHTNFKPYKKKKSYID